jgi:adenylate cyclase
MVDALHQMRIHLTLRRSLIYVLPLAVLLLAGVARITVPDILDRLSPICFDSYQKTAPREAGDALIRIVDIDDDSLAKIGQWPWRRGVVAQLVEKLRDAGAAVIAFDIDFAEADRTSPKILLPLITQNGVGANEAERVLAGLPDPDSLLAEAMSTIPVVAGFIFGRSG